METIHDIPAPTQANSVRINTDPAGTAVSITLDAEGPDGSPTTFLWANGEYEAHVAYRFTAETRFPPGIFATEYRWDFGDGIVRYGPNVTHTYRASSPDTTVHLCVRDSRKRKTCVTKVVRLRRAAYGPIVAHRGIVLPSV